MEFTSSTVYKLLPKYGLLSKDMGIDYLGKISAVFAGTFSLGEGGINRTSVLLDCNILPLLLTAELSRLNSFAKILAF